MKQIVWDLKLFGIEDILFILVLYCFGLLDVGLIFIFINCKYGWEEIFYQYKFLEFIFNEIYGVFVY